MNKPPLVVCTWKWKPARAYRSTFAAEAVNVLRRAVARHYPHPHEFVCITDDPVGLDPEVRCIPLPDPDPLAAVPSPWGAHQPSCYRRLRMFGADAAQWLGPRFVSLDLDVVICGDLSPLWNRPEPFVMWGDTSPGTPYNGSMVLMTAGARRQVWDDFDPKRSPAMSKAKGYFGSDQAWIATVLGPKEARWSVLDGVYSFRVHILNRRVGLPANARAVFFHGNYDPWDPSILSRHQWVRQNWR